MQRPTAQQGGHSRTNRSCPTRVQGPGHLLSLPLIHSPQSHCTIFSLDPFIFLLELGQLPSQTHKLTLPPAYSRLTIQSQPS